MKRRAQKFNENTKTINNSQLIIKRTVHVTIFWPPLLFLNYYKHVKEPHHCTGCLFYVALPGVSSFFLLNFFGKFFFSLISVDGLRIECVVVQIAKCSEANLWLIGTIIIMIVCINSIVQLLRPSQFDTFLLLTSLFSCSLWKVAC